jgi:multiple sugar transport system ATP-binding protein
MPLKLTGVTKRYGDVTAAENIDLRADDDDFLVLLGPSGSGKTTTLRMIAGLESITEGKISINGKVVNGQEPADRGIAMVFQNYALYPHLTVEENLSLGLKVNGVPKAELTERVEEALEILDIPELWDRKPSELSGGQQQRVALGRAIVREPDVFLMDEPLSNLDAKLRMEMRKELKELKHDLGTTFVYVTHDQVEAMTLATKIAVLNRGRVQQIGTPEELYDHPTNEFVAKFIGSPSMNMFECRVQKKQENVVLDFGVFEQSITGEAATLLRDREFESVTVGIRPEDIRIGDTLSNRAKIKLVEPVEADVHVYLTVNGRELVVETNRPRNVVEIGQRYPRGSAVTFEFPSDSLHFFKEGTAVRRQSGSESHRTEVA